MCLKNYCPVHREERESGNHAALWITLGAVVTVLVGLAVLLCKILSSLRSLCRSFDSLEFVEEPEMEADDVEVDTEIMEDAEDNE